MGDNEDCPCGLQGIDCDIPLPSIDVDQALKRPCSSGGGECIESSGGVECNCFCGFGGDFCEETLSPSGANIILGTFVGVLAPTAAIFGLYYLSTLYSNWQKNTKKITAVESRLSFVTPKLLLAYRITNFIIYIPILIVLTVPRPEDLFTFTMTNWNLLGIYFLIGIILSVKHLLTPVSAEDPAGILEYIFFVMLEILLPSAIALTLVLWILIFPSADDDLRDILLEPGQFFVHGINVLMLGVEFMLNDVFVTKFHSLYAFIVGPIYVLLHQLRVIYFDARNDPPCSIYDFLDPSQDLYIVNVIGLTIFFVIFYYVVFGLSKVKEIVSPKPTDNVEKLETTD